MGQMWIATYVVQDLNTRLRTFAIQTRDKNPAILFGQDFGKGLGGLGFVYCTNRTLPQLLVNFSHGPPGEELSSRGNVLGRQSGRTEDRKVSDVDHTVAALYIFFHTPTEEGVASASEP